MADQERNCTRELTTMTLEHGLQVMLDLLTDYFGNKATRTEWVVEIQKRFTGRDGKLRRGWSDDSIDRKIDKLEEMGLITGGRGQGAYYSAPTARSQGDPHPPANYPQARMRPASLMRSRRPSSSSKAANRRPRDVMRHFERVVTHPKHRTLYAPFNGGLNQYL